MKDHTGEFLAKVCAELNALKGERDGLAKALEALLECPALNEDFEEPETREAIDAARDVLADIRKGA